MTTIELEALTVRRGRERIIDDVILSVPSGQVLAVVGASGSGKTTLLRAIAGLERDVAGFIRFDDADVTFAEPRDRNVSFVFQSPVLFPRRSVRRNIAFPLEIDHRSADEIRERVGAEARALHIEALLRRSPKELSAGEAQVVQVARALVKQPDVMLLDEPLANVDAHHATTLRRELGIIQRGFSVTTLLATNDPMEAMALGDYLAVLERGTVVQCDTPERVYAAPSTVTAALMTGAADVLDVRVETETRGAWLTRPGLRVRAWQPAVAALNGRRLQLVVRPEWWRRDRNGTIEAVVMRRAPLGSVTELWCTLGGKPATVKLAEPCNDVGVGDRITLRLDRFVLIDPRHGRVVGDAAAP